MIIWDNDFLYFMEKLGSFPWYYYLGAALTLSGINRWYVYLKHANDHTGLQSSDLKKVCIKREEAEQKAIEYLHRRNNQVARMSHKKDSTRYYGNNGWNAHIINHKPDMKYPMSKIIIKKK